MVLGEKTVREVIYLLGIAIVIAFIVNYFSPKGIALKGNWNPEDGVISAEAKDSVVVRDIEIQSVPEAKKIYDENLTLFVDARHLGTHNEGYIKGSVSLSVYEYDNLIDAFLEKYPSDRKIVIYCSGRECDESHRLATYLKDEGYLNIRVFVDGFPAWEEAGFPIEKQNGSE